MNLLKLAWILGCQLAGHEYDRYQEFWARAGREQETTVGLWAFLTEIDSIELDHAEFMSCMEEWHKKHPTED